MRTRGPFSGNLIAIGAGLGRSEQQDARRLSAGAVVSLRVLADLGGGRYRVSAGESFFLAQSASPLKTGSVFSARVERSGSSLVLRPLSGAARRFGQASISEAGLRLDAGRGTELATKAFLAALLKEGLAPQAESLERLRRIYLRPGLDAKRGKGEGSEREERLSLAARLEAAGIPAEEATVDAIQAEAGGFGAEREGLGQKGNGASNGKPPDASVGGGLDLERDIELQVPEAELPALLGRLIREIAFRSGGEGCLLNLFNHRPGADGNWTYAPFRFELDSIAFEGTLRIKSPRIRGGPGRIEASFSASRRREDGEAALDRNWSFSLDFGAGAAFRLDCIDIAAAESARRKLGELRAALAATSWPLRVRFGQDEADIPASKQEGGGVDVEA